MNNPNTSESNAEEKLRTLRSIGHAILTSIRFILWLIILIFVPLALVPSFQRTFEEFGVELSFITQFLVANSERAYHFAFVYVPVALILLTCWETLILLSPKTSRARVLKYVDWGLLVATIVYLTFSLVVPLISIVSGLADS